MYLRSTLRRNKDGSEVRYLQLAHNVWDPAAKRSRVQVVYNFGREEPGTREALERLVASVSRHPDPGKAAGRAAEGLEFAESRPLGGTHVLDALRERLGIGPATRGLLKGRRLDPRGLLMFAPGPPDELGFHPQVLLLKLLMPRPLPLQLGPHSLLLRHMISRAAWRFTPQYLL